LSRSSGRSPRIGSGKALRDKYEGIVDKSLGTIVAVLGADSIGEGHILAGDGSI